MGGISDARHPSWVLPALVIKDSQEKFDPSLELLSTTRTRLVYKKMFVSLAKGIKLGNALRGLTAARIDEFEKTSFSPPLPLVVSRSRNKW
jgi:hypothetical protein